MALNFAKLSSKAGLTQLNTYLASRVYVFGLEPTTQDADLFALIGKAPDATAYPNVARYYAHIESFGAGKASFAKLEGLTVSDAPAAAAAAMKAKAEAAAKAKKKGKKRRPPERP